MKESFHLIWISPIVSQHDLEDWYHWVNDILSQTGFIPLPGFSAIRTSMVFEPQEALRLEIAIPGPSSGNAIPLLKEAIWSEVFAASHPCPPPFALSLHPAHFDGIRKKLVCFDMDSTLINQEVIDEIARNAGFFEEVSTITEQAMLGKLDFTQSLRARVALFRGMSKAKVLTILPALTVSPGGESLLQFLRSLGTKTAVVSGGFEFILRHFQKTLFLDHVYGNVLGMEEDETLSGTVEEPVVDATYKQKLLARMRENYGFSKEETVAIGDGANDILMMNEAGITVSFCGKPKLSAHANTLILERNLLWLKSLI